eukprot:c23087_g1_i1.p1 GENE.c23087_g1_i1~~c23087_g1_i1.p1  ORF type:complete len:288 (+),score=46.92 c23087_g1_i1:151-1014(+)
MDNDVRRNATLFQEYVVTLCRQRDCMTEAASRSVFLCASAPPIALRDYALRFADHMLCSAQSFVCAATFIQRFHQVNPEVFVLPCAHKLMLGAQLLGIKFSDDKFYPISYYSQVGGVTPAVLVQIEEEFARVVAFRFFVSLEDYTCTLQMLEAAHDSLQPAFTIKPVEEPILTLRTPSVSSPFFPAADSARYRSVCLEPVAAIEPTSSIFDHVAMHVKDTTPTKKQKTSHTTTSIPVVVNSTISSNDASLLSPVPISALVHPLPLHYAPLLVSCRFALQLGLDELCL